MDRDSVWRELPGDCGNDGEEDDCAIGDVPDVRGAGDVCSRGLRGDDTGVSEERGRGREEDNAGEEEVADDGVEEEEESKTLWQNVARASSRKREDNRRRSRT